MPDCPICIEPLNKSVRRPVSCPYCNVAICRACAKECLLLSYEPKCQFPDCGKLWSEDFLLDVMAKTWMYGEYRKHREKYALDLERARLPETQTYAKQFKEAQQAYDTAVLQITKLKDEMDQTPQGQRLKAHSQHIRSLNKIYEEFCKKHKLNRYYETLNEIQSFSKQIINEKKRMRKNIDVAVANRTTLTKELNDVTKHLSLQIQKLKSEKYYKDKYTVISFGRIPELTNSETREPPKKNWTFTMKCPAETCEGFIGLDWTCGLCSVKVCKDCREIKEDETSHTCDPAKRESVAALAKEAKPCPKCAAQISKIDGCDQMWCTQCHTAFSWRTGTIEQNVHNPHYYEWMRRNGQAIPRAGPALNECLTPRQTLGQAELYLASKLEMLEIFMWIQPISHTLNYSMNNLTRTAHQSEQYIEEQKRILRVKRLVNLIDDTKWGTALELINIQKRRAIDAHNILQMFINAACDILRHAMIETANVKDCARQMQKLATYTNEQILNHNSKYKDSLELINKLT